MISRNEVPYTRVKSSQFFVLRFFSLKILSHWGGYRSWLNNSAKLCSFLKSFSIKTPDPSCLLVALMGSCGHGNKSERPGQWREGFFLCNGSP